MAELDGQVKLLIVDDNSIFVDGIATLIESSPVAVTVGTGGDLAEAKQLIDAGGFDILLADLHIPFIKGNGGGGLPVPPDDSAPSIEAGLEMIRYCVKRRPEAKIIVLTYSTLAGHFFKANQAGAHAYLVKDDLDGKKLIADLMTVAGGGRPGTVPQLEKKMWEAQKKGFLFPYGLTEKEIKILRLMTRGAKDKEIARQLFLVDRTVHRYVETIRDKLGVDNRAQAIALAVREGLVE